MYDKELAGGNPYPITEKYQYDNWYSTSGLTDTSEYRTIRFNCLQDNLLLHWHNAYLEIHGRLWKNADNDDIATSTKVSFIHNAILHLFSNVKFSVGNRVIKNINSPSYVSSMIFAILFPKSKKDCQRTSVLLVSRQRRWHDR